MSIPYDGNHYTMGIAKTHVIHKFVLKPNNYGKCIRSVLVGWFGFMAYQPL